MHRPESASRNCQDERDATEIVGLIQLGRLKPINARTGQIETLLRSDAARIEEISDA
jgi:DNA mismatch repair protein MutH